MDTIAWFQFKLMRFTISLSDLFLKLEFLSIQNLLYLSHTQWSNPNNHKFYVCRRLSGHFSIVPGRIDRRDTNSVYYERALWFHLTYNHSFAAFRTIPWRRCWSRVLSFVSLHLLLAEICWAELGWKIPCTYNYNSHFGITLYSEELLIVTLLN